MSFQAYLDNVEEKTGKTPNQFIAEAKEKNLTEFKDIIAWLKKDYGLGLGHARAIAYVIRNGPNFEVRQTTGSHRDISGTLKLDGAGRKSKKAKKK
jgi:phage anti-repressor protein